MNRFDLLDYIHQHYHQASGVIALLRSIRNGKMKKNESRSNKQFKNVMNIFSISFIMDGSSKSLIEEMTKQTSVSTRNQIELFMTHDLTTDPINLKWKVTYEIICNSYIVLWLKPSSSLKLTPLILSNIIKHTIESTNDSEVLVIGFGSQVEVDLAVGRSLLTRNTEG